MQIDFGQLVVWLITGALAGYIAGQLFRRRGFGAFGNILVGLVGAVIGGLLFNLLNIQITGLPEFRFSVADLVTAIIGAVLLLFVAQLTRR